MKHISILTRPWAALGLATALMGATTAAGAAPAPVPAGQALGQQVYTQRCAICHAPTGVGHQTLARRSAQPDLAARGDVPATLVRHVVRHGIGLMAPFTKVAISDSELASVAAYLGRGSPKVPQ